MPKIIIGIVGETAAGKTTATNYLVTKYQAVSFRFSDPLSDMLNRLYLEKNRPNLQKLSMVIRQHFGDNILSKTLKQDMEKSSAKIIIMEGIRRLGDIEHLKDLPNFILLAITTDIKTRYARLINRTEKSDDQTKTFEQFQQEAKHESEQHIQTIIMKAKFVINNESTKEELYTNLDRIITQLI